MEPAEAPVVFLRGGAGSVFGSWRDEMGLTCCTSSPVSSSATGLPLFLALSFSLAVLTAWYPVFPTNFVPLAVPLSVAMPAFLNESLLLFQNSDMISL